MEKYHVFRGLKKRTKESQGREIMNKECKVGVAVKYKTDNTVYVGI